MQADPMGSLPRTGRVRPGLLLTGLLAAVLGLTAWLALHGPGNSQGPGFGVPRGPAAVPVGRAVERTAHPIVAWEPGSGEVDLVSTGSAEGIGRTAAATAPAGPRSVAGQVLARADGRPVAEARVRLVQGPSQIQGSTDGEGRFELAWSGPGVPALEVRALGFVPARLPRAGAGATVESEAEPLVVRLVEGATIEGSVLGPPTSGEGAPTVRVYSRLQRRGGSQELARGAVDVHGAFRFSELPPGEYLVAAEAPGRVLAVAGASLEPGQRAEVLLELSRAGRLAGRVLDPRARPLEGVRVRIENQRQGLDGNVQAASRREAVTGPDGRFALVGLAAGENRVELLAPWGEQRQESISLARAGEEVARDFELRPPATLAGRVLDEGGRPVSGAQVELAWDGRVPPLIEARGGPDEQRRGSSARTRADEQGAFLLENLPAGRSAVLVAVPPGASDPRLAVEVGVELRAGEEHAGLELVLSPARRLEGRVLLEGAGPLAGARVDLVPRVPGRGRVEALRAETDLEGRFAFSSLPPGAYRITARHADAHSLSESVDLQDSIGDLLLELEGALSLGGLVLDEHGLAVPSSGVRVSRLDPLEETNRDRRWARADSYGRFELRELAAGLYELVPFARGYQSLGEPVLVRLPGQDDVLLELRREAQPPPALVEGRVQIAGTREPPLGFEVRGARGAFLFYEDGRFRLEGLPAGTHRLELAAQGCVPLVLEPLELAPGARVDLGIRALEPGTLVRVEVRDARGERVAGVRVGLRPTQEGASGAIAPRFAERGRGRHEAMVPRGNWRLVVEAPGLRRETRRVEVLPQGLQRVEVTLQPQAP